MSADEELIRALPGDLRRIAEVAGLEAAVRIGQAFRGTLLYVSGVDDMVRAVRDEMIRREYDAGKPSRRLALKYGLTQRQIQKILKSPSAPVHERVTALLGESLGL